MRAPFVVVIALAGCTGSSPRLVPTPIPEGAPLASSEPITAAPSVAIDAGAPETSPYDAGVKVVVIATSNPPSIAEAVWFDVDATKIKPEAKYYLDAVADVMKTHPEVFLVQVEGHTDVRGTPKQQLAIAQKRAEVVLEALVSRGIDRSRLRAKGFGAFCPMEGTAKPERDRRVTLKVAKTASGPKPAPDLGCSAATSAGVVSDPVP